MVVLTKSDLVDEEMMEIVLYDIQCEMKGTFLEDAPIVPVSAFTGQGMDELKSLIAKMAEEGAAKRYGKTLPASGRQGVRYGRIRHRCYRDAH